MTQQELTTKIEELEELVESGSDYIEAEHQAREMLETPEIIANSNIHCRTLLALSSSLWRRGMNENALPCAEQALSIATQEQNKYLEAKSLYKIGVTYNNLSDYHISMDYIKRALLLYQELNDQEWIAGCFGFLGILNNNLCDYSHALEYYYKANEIYEGIYNKKGIAMNYCNIGIVYLSPLRKVG